jgi:rod shape determining protein RodA
VSGLSELLPKRIDPAFLFATLLLTATGLLMVYSTTSGTPLSDHWGKQLLFVAAGVTVAIVLVTVDYRILLKSSPTIFLCSLLLLVYLPIFGTRIAGAKSWIKLPGGFSIQPSEFVKLSTALLIAWILENDDHTFLSRKTGLLVVAAAGIPVSLILFQPDLGVALTYVPLVITGLFLGGLRLRWWILSAVLAVVLVGSSWFFLKEYQKDRIRTFLDPDLAARGAGYQVRQARIAIGSGRILGKGFKKGTQSRLGFLPVRHTDFVFAALAEEQGFVGVASILGLYGLFLSRGFAIARDARDRGGSILVLLLVIDIVVQALVNIAMNVGILPTTGITLPFISYGGSSLLACWAMAGLCLSVSYRRFVNV